MHRRKLVAALVLLGALLGPVLFGSAAQAFADVPRVDIPVNRGW